MLSNNVMEHFQCNTLIKLKLTILMSPFSLSKYWLAKLFINFGILG